MYQVIKRDGQIVDFHLSKINQAITKAFNACNTPYHPDIIDFLTLKVTADFAPKVKEGCIQVEDIQDSVEQVLGNAGYGEVAKAYILYRKQREKIRNMKSTILDYKEIVNNYVKVNDWRVKENSTVTYSVGGLILSNSGALTANYWLSEIYDPEIADAHRNADIHIHDLSMLTGYCAGWSLKQLLLEGLGGIPGKITSAPAKHLATLCNQMVNFLGIMQNEWAGAQAFSSFDTYLAPFIKTDHLSYREVKKCIESFVFGVNTPSRGGTQAPFSNISLDWTVPDDLAEMPAIMGGKSMDFKYKDCKKEMDMINKAFIETMIEGDANGRGFQYPIPTYSITKDFDWSDTENNRLLFEMTSKYGTPYFSNYINSDMEPGDVRSMCCRLRLDLRELRKKSGGFFGSGESTGSVGVVTINLPRIAYLAKDEGDFYARLDRMMDIAARSLKTKRTVITRLMESGLYPYTKRYLATFENHFSTIGLVGMNEACLNARWLRKDLTHTQAQKFTRDVLNVYPTIKRCMATCTIWKPLRPNPPPTVWPSMTWSNSRTSSRQMRPERLTIPTVPISQLGTPMIYLRRWISRMSCRHCTPPEQYSTLSWAKNCPTGRQPPAWCVKSQSTISCLITPFRPPIRCAKITVTSPVSSIPAPYAVRKQRYTAGSPAIIVPSRTGTMARLRNLKIGSFIPSNRHPFLIHVKKSPVKILRRKITVSVLYPIRISSFSLPLPLAPTARSQADF